MQSLHDIAQLRSWRQQLPTGATLGFVPTMGALHEGHRQLIERCRKECDQVVVSIFVNPTQFNQAADLENYPQPLEQDLAICAKEGVDAVFLPAKQSLYPDDYRYRVQESKASTVLEGAHRPGHFDGVLTIVLKLFQLVAPQRAYFGEKDWQQLQLVKGMVDAFFLPLEIISCPTVRDERGLALSSRNSRLSGDGRLHAANFARILHTSATAAEASQALTQSGFSVEYVEDVDGRRLAAIVYEGVRLIDNIAL